MWLRAGWKAGGNVCAIVGSGLVGVDKKVGFDKSSELYHCPGARQSKVAAESGIDLFVVDSCSTLRIVVRHLTCFRQFPTMLRWNLERRKFCRARVPALKSPAAPDSSESY